MPAFSAPSAAVGLAVVAVIVELLRRMLHVDHDPREPPLIPSRIPLLGHVIAMYRQGKKYYWTLEEQYGYDMYTLALPGGKQYVVTTPALTAAANRHKPISFRPFLLEMTKRAFEFDEHADRINWLNLFDENGRGLISDNHDVFYSMLPAGPALDEVTATLLTGVTGYISDIMRRGQVSLSLADFCKTVVCVPNLRALWGPRNPFDQDPSLFEAFWDMEAGQIALAVGILPSIIARKAYLGRKRLQHAMTDYVEKGGLKEASSVVQARADVHFRHGYTKKMFAHAEIGFFIGALPNPSYSLFWFLAHILSDPAFLQEIRHEAETAVERAGDRVIVDVSKLRSGCPLLNSAYREMLRLYMPNTSMRTVREDTIFADRYLLKKGSTVAIEGGLLHCKPSIWGSDASEFNPRRFMGNVTGVITAPGPDNGKKVHPAAYRPFGAGEVVCPGRNMARVEAVAVAVAVVTSFDVTDGGGNPIEVPPPINDVTPVGVWRPREDVMIGLKTRAGLENVRWEYRM